MRKIRSYRGQAELGYTIWTKDSVFLFEAKQVKQVLSTILILVGTNLPILHWLEITLRETSGHIRSRGRNEGKYPYRYLEMIDTVFGPEENTIEVCSHSVKGKNDNGNCFTVDLNPATNPDLIDDAQSLCKVESNSFNRWRADPPYNGKTASSMYNTKLPITSKLLQAGARVCKANSLLFLLLGPKNHQFTPAGVKRIGWIAITIVPNNELRTLHIFYKIK